MPVTSKEIITAIENDFPQTNNEVIIRNCSDLDVEGKVNTGFQYLIGITRSDPMQTAIYHYKDYMKNKLAQVSLGCECRGWSFGDDEMDNAKTVLKELSEHFNASIDIDRMIRKLNFKIPEGEVYYIVITIIFIPLISVEQAE